jgi:hypothetical protein
MTIDERIEALTESVALIGPLHVELERQTAAHFAETATRFAEMAARFAETGSSFVNTFQLINQLARVVQATSNGSTI